MFRPIAEPGVGFFAFDGVYEQNVVVGKRDRGRSFLHPSLPAIHTYIEDGSAPIMRYIGLYRPEFHRYPPYYERDRYFRVVIPFWLLGVIPALFIVRRVRWPNRSIRLGLCVKCGYDRPMPKCGS